MAHTSVRDDRAPTQSRRDRWADWAVIGVLAVALLLGSVVMVLAQGRRETAVDAEAGVSVRYPQGWLLKGQGEGLEGQFLIFEAVDLASGTFKTTFQVRAVPVDATGAVTSTLSLVLNNLSLSRAQNATAYRQLDLIESSSVDGQPAMEAHYVYVHEGSDLFVQQIPVVVRGLDVAAGWGDKAYVLTLQAADDVFPAAEKEFRRFVASARLGAP